MTGGKVRGGRLNKTGEKERRRGRFDWLLSSFLASFLSSRRLSFHFRFFCLINCVFVSVSLTVFPVECVSGGVVEGVVKVEQDR